MEKQVSSSDESEKLKDIERDEVKQSRKKRKFKETLTSPALSDSWFINSNTLEDADINHLRTKTKSLFNKQPIKFVSRIEGFELGRLCRVCKLWCTIISSSSQLWKGKLVKENLVKKTELQNLVPIDDARLWKHKYRIKFLSRAKKCVLCSRPQVTYFGKFKDEQGLLAVCSLCFQKPHTFTTKSEATKDYLLKSKDVEKLPVVTFQKTKKKLILGLDAQIYSKVQYGTRITNNQKEKREKKTHKKSDWMEKVKVKLEKKGISPDASALLKYNSNKSSKEAIKELQQSIELQKKDRIEEMNRRKNENRRESKAEKWIREHELHPHDVEIALKIKGDTLEIALRCNKARKFAKLFNCRFPAASVDIESKYPKLLKYLKSEGDSGFMDILSELKEIEEKNAVDYFIENELESMHHIHQAIVFSTLSLNPQFKRMMLEAVASKYPCNSKFKINTAAEVYEVIKDIRVKPPPKRKLDEDSEEAEVKEERQEKDENDNKAEESDEINQEDREAKVISHTKVVRKLPSRVARETAIVKTIQGSNIQSNSTNKLVVESDSEIESKLVQEKQTVVETPKAQKNKRKDMLHWIGKRVKVYWEGERAWFFGTVKSLNDKNEPVVAYDDGDLFSEQEEDLVLVTE